MIPTKIPSLRARSWLQRIASAPAIASRSSNRCSSMASPVIQGMKSGVQPCMGWGFQAGCLAAGAWSGLRACGWPEPISWASAGSQTTIRVLGLSLRSTRPTPVRVPPVP